ncbi:MAG: CpXC domain-containing protein [Myxococcales bacterium]|nr:CpXC domain-containing protein [Myxococcales bacterium]
MVIRGTTRVSCPACGEPAEVELVQSINTRTHPTDKLRLLAGELNVLTCDACDKRTQLASDVLFHDPDADYYCHVVPGGEAAMRQAEAVFSSIGATGTQRLVPSLNALVEKVKILDAGLSDWAIEMTKVLLLASISELDRVLLFAAVDRDKRVLRWVLFDEDGRAPEPVSSSLDPYDKLAARAEDVAERRVDRAWALEAIKAMIASTN